MPTYLAPGVYVEEVQSGSRPIEGVGTAVAAFVGFAEEGPVNTPTLVSNWSQYASVFGGFVAGAFLPHAVYGYFMNGGGNCYVVRMAGADGADGAVGGSGRSGAPGGRRQGGTVAGAASSAPQAEAGRLRFVALDPGTKPGDITVEVVEAGGDSPTDDMFKLLVRGQGDLVEEFDRATVGRGRQNAANMVASSKLIRIEEIPQVSAQRPDLGSYVLVAPPPPGPAVLPPMTRDDYLGDVAERTGVGGLEAIDEITMVCAPDLMSVYQQGALDLETVQAVQLGMIAHCELMGDRVAILDSPPGLNPQQIKEWRVDKAGYDSKYAALYWPWIRVADPATGQMTHVPPSGHMAGIWGRNDDTRGVHKAPANEVVRGAVSLECQITKNEHGLLNPVGINCLRAFPGGGLRVYGARTLSSDPAWRYLNIRRLFNYLEESILNGTQWVVFEPNDRMLWATIRRTISDFLVREWLKGALFGQTPEEAFYVKCDDETNVAQTIDAGQVICQIGVAPVKPAEFVVFRLAQFSGGTSLVAE